jgi:hypothetical protein
LVPSLVLGLVPAARTALAGDSNAPVEYPRDWGPDLCLAENGTRVVETSSTATSADALIDGFAGEGHQWEPSWSNGLPASFTLRLSRVERWNKIVFTTRTAGEGFPRECELWVGKTQADLHCERTFTLAQRNVQIADLDPVEGQYLRIVVKSTWKDEELEIGEVAIFLHAAAPPHAAEGKDSVELRTGDKLLGELQGDAWTFRGRFFEVKIGHSDLVGARLSDDGDRVFLASGEVLAGELRVESVSLKLESGQVVDLPRGKVASLATRARNGEFPAKPEDLSAKGSVASLESGERWLARPIAPRVEVETTFGRVGFPLEAVQSIAFGQGTEPLDRVVLANGDTFHGFVLAENGEVGLKLALGPEVRVPKGVVQQLAFGRELECDPGPPENQRVALKTGDLLSGTLAAENLPLRTSYATVDVPLASLDRLEATEGGRVRVSLRDGTALAGRPAVDALSFDLDAGGRVQLPIDRVRRIENWRLPAATLARVDALVKSLDDPSWPKRDAAKGELARLGRIVLPRLSKVLREGTPEEKKSANDVLALIRSEEAK